ncbi:DUF1441 family protein [Vannielia litorea]|nr:DUF1441 family protein [Vannielia litorea]
MGWKTRALYPLPDGVEDVVVNRSQIARALAVSEPTITKWIGAGMPVLEEGGNGREYAFQLGDCYAWRMAREAEASAARGAAEAAASQLAMQFIGADEGDDLAGLSALEIERLSDAAYKRNRTAEQQGELVRAHRVRALFESMMVLMVNTLEALPDYAEREFGLTPEQVERLQARCGKALNDCRQQLEELTRGTGEVVAMTGGQEALPLE